MQVLLQRIQEYLDHVLLQLVDVVGVLLQGVADCCLEVDGVLIDDDGGNGVFMVLMTIDDTDDYFCRESQIAA